MMVLAILAHMLAGPVGLAGVAVVFGLLRR